MATKGTEHFRAYSRSKYYIDRATTGMLGGKTRLCMIFLPCPCSASEPSCIHGSSSAARLPAASAARLPAASAARLPAGRRPPYGCVPPSRPSTVTATRRLLSTSSRILSGTSHIPTWRHTATDLKRNRIQRRA